MANKIRGEANFKIGEKTYTLCYNNEALIQLEDQLDKGIVAIMNEMQKWKEDPERVRLKWIRALLWAGLHKYQPQLDVEQVGELLEQTNTVDVMTAIGDAMSKAFSDPESEMKDARPTTNASMNGSGTSSSPNTSPTDIPPIPSGQSPPAS